MLKFKVLISEHLTHTFIVEAETEEEIEMEPEKSDTTDWVVVSVAPFVIEASELESF